MYQNKDMVYQVGKKDYQICNYLDINTVSQKW